MIVTPPSRGMLRRGWGLVLVLGGTVLLPSCDSGRAGPCEHLLPEVRQLAASLTPPETTEGEPLHLGPDGSSCAATWTRIVRGDVRTALTWVEQHAPAGYALFAADGSSVEFRRVEHGDAYQIVVRWLPHKQSVHLHYAYRASPR